MKLGKRVISAILLLAMIASMIPATPITKAATEVAYVLDTDGIDVGAQYLIVSGTGATADALMLNTAATWRTSVTSVSVADGNTIASFSNENNCLWTFSSSTNGTVSCNGYYLNIDQYSRYQTNAATMQFANLDDGRYGIYVGGGTFRNLQYLYYNSGAAETERFTTKYNWGASGTNASSYDSYLYLYKRVETQTNFTVEFLGNGNTAGTVPAAIKDVEEGQTITMPAPSEDFRKDSGNDTYLFWCWTENEDGTGTEYKAGQTYTVTKDTTFYAQYYKQIKYAVTVITDLDDVPTDLDKILGEDVTIYIKGDLEGSTLQKLEKTQDGTYVAYVTENGTYTVYTQHGDEDPKEAHGHKVVVYNQDGSTELLNYSVSYDANGGAFAQAPEAKNYHANTVVTATDLIPTLEGNRFLGWKDQNGKPIAPGEIITDALREKTVLTAQWEDLIDVTVNVTVDYRPATGGEDVASAREEASFLLMQMINGAYQPYGEVVSLDENHQGYVPGDGVATYTVKYSDMPKGDYIVSGSKSGYKVEVTKKTLENGDEIIDMVYTYAPDNFDLQFNVQVDMEGVPAQLRPQAVNLRVTCWMEEEGGWKTITQHEQGTAPVTVFIDENGNGTGFYPVWKTRSDDGSKYIYRVRVSSFVMPDGTVVEAKANVADVTTYSPVSSGLYAATVTVDGGDSDLNGAYCDGDVQVGDITVDVKVTPFTVTFLAGDGLLDQQTVVVLENQYKYPNLRQFVPVPNEYDGKFSGWYVDGEKAENLAGQYLTGDVTYEAQYNPHIKVTGTVYVDNTYQLDGEPVEMLESDRLKTLRVVLQKNINGVYNDVDSRLVQIVPTEGVNGEGEYTFDNLVDDGTAYRVYVLLHNYDVSYSNDLNTEFTPDEYTAIFRDSVAQVDLQLKSDPESYDQLCLVDTQRISEAFRPDNVKIQVLYRDLGDTLPYKVISHHTVDEEGLKLPIMDNGQGAGAESVWKWHNNGSLYEYQVDVVTLYGQVNGVFTQDGVEYSTEMPFTVQYDMPAYYAAATDAASAPLRATLIPKDYKIIFDLGLPANSTEHIQGMDDFLVDNGDEDQYAYIHTWSFAKDFTAFPYREGHVFAGWESSHEGVLVTNQGRVHIGAELAEDITLKAVWIPLEGTAYTVRHLELNTDKVLMGAQAVTGEREGSRVQAAVAAKAIKGYVYAGAIVNGTFYDKSANPELVVTTNPKENLLVIYYLPDGSDGYTEQVESNLHLDKTAVLENDGTYTITMETYTKDNPITTLIQQNTPMDIVLVLDQSGSIIQSGYLDELQTAVNNFVGHVAEHGRENEVDHRIAIVGYAGDGDEPPTSTDTSSHPIAGGNTSEWVNTGVFDSNGDFHPYPVTGFNYTEYTGAIETDGVYYTQSDGEYLLLTYHENYRHLITEDEARIATLKGETVYGYVDNQFVELTRNTSGLWLYGDKQLYSLPEFFTFHQNVWTHRKDLEYRQIHAYMINGVYTPVDGHEGVYTRSETRETNPQLDVYKDALVPVSVGANGSGGVNPGLTKSTTHLGSNGGTFIQYGVEMANRVFAANPLTNDPDRIRVMIMFTDGMPGIGTFDENVANEAISQAYTAKNTHKAYSYTVGLYSSNGTAETNDVGYFMNAVSSNYPKAQDMDDVRASESYSVVSDGTRLNSGGPYYVEVDGVYYELSMQVRYSNRTYWYCWGYTGRNGRVDIVQNTVANQNPSVSNGMVGGYLIYKRSNGGYKETPYSGYYSTTDSEKELQQYFEHILTEITTKITTEIILHDDTILRDIMGQGLVLTPNTEIVAYRQLGEYNATAGTITWTNTIEEVARVTIPENPEGTVYSEKTTDVEYTLPDGTVVSKENVPYISVYNLDSQNPTDPNNTEVPYHPHTIDITGYDFDEWYISDTKETGWKMVVTVNKVEARDDVVWGRATQTNYDTSGLWLPADAHGRRELLLPFDQPTTIFVERAYVLDYGKEFELSGWYFDSEDGKEAQAVHLDCQIEDGMNGFGTPTKENGGNTGNTQYGNVKISEGKVTYKPTTTQWGGYDQFYVFGNTWRKTVKAQDANENGNLWNKVTVIPANNIYYEDSFVTSENPDPSDGFNAVSGFVFTGDWAVENGNNPGQNTETPEHMENETYGDTHGWTDSLADDAQYSDGSAHVAFPNGFDKENNNVAKVSFSFTGTGVDVYTRTTNASGMVAAVLTGKTTEGKPVTKTVIMDNLSVSGDYYQIPTISFTVPYGTYQVTLGATQVNNVAVEGQRYQYYVDGIRVYNPLGNTMNNADAVIKDAYGKELNAVFTEIRDIMLKYDDFTSGLTNDGKTGAVFIDWIREGQESGNDAAGVGTNTYEVGTTYATYGPKNEVYLAQGQAVVLKVDSKNTYYVGMKAINLSDEITAATVNVSGLSKADPQTITVGHSTDLYYEVTPIDGYLVIQNSSENGALLALTKLRTTNMSASSAENGVLNVKAEEAVRIMSVFSRKLEEPQDPVTPTPEPELPQEPEQMPEIGPDYTVADKIVEAQKKMTQQLFTTVRAWLEEKGGAV